MISTQYFSTILSNFQTSSDESLFISDENLEFESESHIRRDDARRHV